MLDPVEQYVSLVGNATEGHAKLEVGNVSYSRKLGKTVRRRYKQLVMNGKL